MLTPIRCSSQHRNRHTYSRPHKILRTPFFSGSQQKTRNSCCLHRRRPSNASSNAFAVKKWNRRFDKENPTIFKSTIHVDAESDENYEDEECSDSEDDHDVADEDNDSDVYIDDDGIDMPVLNL